MDVIIPKLSQRNEFKPENTTLAVSIMKLFVQQILLKSREVVDQSEFSNCGMHLFTYLSDLVAVGSFKVLKVLNTRSKVSVLGHKSLFQILFERNFLETTYFKYIEGDFQNLDCFFLMNY